MNKELISEMRQVAKAIGVLFGNVSAKLVKYDTYNDIARLGREETENMVKRTDSKTGKSYLINANVYLWAIRRSGTTLLRLCQENKDDLQVAIEHKENIAFFRIEGGGMEPITRSMARLIAASL